MSDTRRPVRLGIRANLAQFSLLVAVNALVGGMIGQERTVLPLLAEREFHHRARSVVVCLTRCLTRPRSSGLVHGPRHEPPAV